MEAPATGTRTTGHGRGEPAETTPRRRQSGIDGLARRRRVTVDKLLGTVRPACSTSRVPARPGSPHGEPLDGWLHEPSDTLVRSRGRAYRLGLPLGKDCAMKLRVLSMLAAFA